MRELHLDKDLRFANLVGYGAQEDRARKMDRFLELSFLSSAMIWNRRKVFDPKLKMIVSPSLHPDTI